jgi:hypothetical protein
LYLCYSAALNSSLYKLHYTILHYTFVLSYLVSHPVNLSSEVINMKITLFLKGKYSICTTMIVASLTVPNWSLYKFLFIPWGGERQSPLVMWPQMGLLYQTLMTDWYGALVER